METLARVGHEVVQIFLSLDNGVNACRSFPRNFPREAFSRCGDCVVFSMPRDFQLLIKNVASASVKFLPPACTFRFTNEMQTFWVE
jgi:hypothetical protein